MTDDQFQTLVARLEEEARRNPSGYKARTFLLALGGNLYLALILLLLVAAFLLSLVSVAWLKAAGVKLVIILGAFLWMVLKALWVRFEPPAGVEVNRSEAPELFRLVDELRRELQAPRFSHVLVTEEFNAAVVQMPRFGIFGGHRNYLLLGLPLMKLMTDEQLKAVLAHEFGHLARGHGRLGNWLYGQRLRWSRLLAAIDANEGKGGFLFKPFLKRFAPYFNAYSFPLARANEYEADATAVRLTSASAMAEALTGVNVIGTYLQERYWPHVYRQADEQPQPSFAPYGGMDLRVAGEVEPAVIEKWMQQALGRETTFADTHPALKDRLAAFGGAAALVLPGHGRGADRLLGPAEARVAGVFDQRWRAGVLPAWEERFNEVQTGRARVADLEARQNGGEELSLQEAFDRAVLTDSVLRDAERAVALFRELHLRAPDNPHVCYGLGMRLLARDDDEGRAFVERAMELDESAIVAGSELLRDYCWRTGRKEEAHAWHQRMVERTELERAAEAERSRVTLADELEPHGLPEEVVAQVVAQLRGIKGLRGAWLVRKRVKHFQERPCYFFAFRATGTFQFDNKRREREVLDRISEAVAFPAETRIINVDGENRRFRRMMDKVRSARLI